MEPVGEIRERISIFGEMSDLFGDSWDQKGEGPGIKVVIKIDMGLGHVVLSEVLKPILCYSSGYTNLNEGAGA